MAAAPPDTTLLYRELADALRAAFLAAREGADADQVRSALSVARSLAGRVAAEAHALDPLDRDAAVSALQTTLEEHGREILDDADMEGDALALGLAVLRGASRLVLRVTRAACNVEPLDETPFLLLDLQELSGTLDPSEDLREGLREDQHVRAAPTPQRELDRERPVESTSAEGSTSVDAADAARAALLACTGEVRRARSQRLLASAAKIVAVSAENAEDAFRLYRALGTSSEEISSHASPSAQDVEIRFELDREATRIQARLFGFCERAATPVDQLALTALTTRTAGELDEGRMQAFDADSRDLGDLRSLHDFGRRLSRHYRRRVKGVPRNARGDTATLARPITHAHERRLRRMVRRVRNTLGDRVLHGRLTRVFGSKIVSKWEAFIFWLIMGELALLLINHYLGGTADGLDWMVLVDTAICAVLLLDYSVRVALSPERIRYAARHFLTEFVPSIPFGFLINIEHVGWMSSVKALRMVRVFRVLRVARPVIRVLRLMLFVARAADRLVERNAWLLNRDIVFFTDGDGAPHAPTLIERAQDLDGWISRGTQVALAALTERQQLTSISLRIEIVRDEVLTLPDSAVLGGRLQRSGSSRKSGNVAREIDVDEVIHVLRELDSKQVAAMVGLDFARQLTASMRFFRLPLLRRIPAIRFVVGERGVPDPLHTTARIGRISGDFLDIARRAICWFADLHGTITGPQFLDRVGEQMVKATQRPAKRLLLFGLIVGVGLAIVKLTHLPFLAGAAAALIKFLSFPVLMLGGVCLIPLMLGAWFRRIAGQAADLYDRIAEAQFLALTEQLKEESADADRQELARRVLLPEVESATTGTPTVSDLVAWMKDEVSPDSSGPPPARLAPLVDLVSLFHRDYQDGACFHSNDTKVANMLLGNLTLENVRQNRLRFGKKRMKKLDRIDIARGKGGLSGAYVWFHSITRALAHQTARLIIEYNQHCIPKEEIASADDEDRRLYDAWLKKRLKISRHGKRQSFSEADSVVPAGTGGTLLYRTTEFNALHFLTDSPARERLVRERFGDVIADLLKEDRENLIRVVFGTFPMHELAKERRTFNPYEFYRAWFSRGKVFFMPAWIALGVYRALKLLVQRLIAIVRDVLDPNKRTNSVQRVHATFEVARRKAHRMRRPVVMEAIKLRAAFDAEYVGLTLPGLNKSLDEEDEIAGDLRRLAATEREWEEFRNVRASHERMLRRLSAFLHDAAARGLRIEASRPGHRALAIAFLCDHEQVRTLIVGHDALRALIKKLAKSPPTKKERRFRLRLPRERRIARMVRSAWATLSDNEATARDEALQARVIAAIVKDGGLVHDALQVLLDRVPPGVLPQDHALRILSSTAQQPGAWTEQMVAVRTVETLAMIDLAGYERLIERLGGYGVDEQGARDLTGAAERI